MKTGISILITGLCLISTASHAQSLRPDPGVWRSESSVLINGTDVLAQMRQAQQAMLDSLPADQRATMQAMLGEMGDMNTNDYCITEQEAARGYDGWLEQAKKEMPNCDISTSGSSGNKILFTGNCRDTGSEGFVGSINGEVEIISNKEVRSRLSGKGIVSLDETAGAAFAGGQTMDIETRDTSRWISGDCSQLPVDDYED